MDRLVLRRAFRADQSRAAVSEDEKVSRPVFVISWIVIVTLLVLVAVRMPAVFLLLFTLVDVSLVLNLLGIIQDSANLTKAAGWALMTVAAVVVYLFLGVASHSTGGREFPLGPPILHA